MPQLQVFDTPSAMVEWLVGEDIGAQCILTGPRSRTQRNQLYRTARRKGIRVGYEPCENGDLLVTKRSHMGEAYGRELKSRDNSRAIKNTHAATPDLGPGEHRHTVRDLLDVSVGESLELTQNEKNIYRDAKRLGIMIRVERCDGYRKVTRLE